MDTTANLTQREFEIGKLTVLGKTKKEIASSLFISVRTVENTMRKVFIKANVNNSTSFSLWWFCKYFGISEEAVRTMISATMLCLLMFHIFTTSDESFRGRRMSTRRNETELIFDEL